MTSSILYYLGSYAVYTSDAAPSNSVGNEGDLCMVTSGDTSNIYMKTSGAWVVGSTYDMLRLGALAKTNNNILIANGTNWNSQQLSLNNIANVIVTNPSANDTLSYNGTNFVNTQQQQTVTQGAIVQVLNGTIGLASGSTSISTGAQPSATTGTQIWNKAITTAANSTRVEINMSACIDTSANLLGGRNITIVLCRGSTVLGVYGQYIDTSNAPHMMTISHIDTLPSTTGATYTYSARIAVNSGTWYIGQDSNGDTYGGRMGSSVSLKEII